MVISPELDLTPESAESLDRFRRFFHTGAFSGLVMIGGFGTTDLQTLYRVMDRIVCIAAGNNLCIASAPMTLAERAETAQEALEVLRSMAREWYESLEPAQQQAFIDLLRSIVAWLQSLGDSLSPEAQAMLAALKHLLGLLLVEQATETAASMGTHAN